MHASIEVSSRVVMWRNCILIIFVGVVLIFLPPYSPDLNPIEESFSCGKLRLLNKLRY